MDNKLIQDTLNSLQREIEAEAYIQLELERDLIEDLAHLLHSYKIAYHRKRTILGAYMLLKIAILRHRELGGKDSKQMARAILDGDYCFGLYCRYVVQSNEFKLLQYVAPIHKRLQLKLIEGYSVEAVLQELYIQFKAFLDAQEEEGGLANEIA